MGNCANCVRSKTKSETITYGKRKTELTIKSFRSTECLGTEPSEFKPQKKEHIRKMSRDANSRIEGDSDVPNAKMIQKIKTQDDRKVIKRALLKHFLFTHLPPGNIDDIIEEMLCYSLGPREVLFRQGDSGHNFFVLAEGILEIIINGTSRGIIKEGNGFGELALIHDSLRTATIRTVEKVTLWGIGRKVFREALKALSSLKFDENKRFLQCIPFLSCLTESQLDSIVAVSVCQCFTNGQKILIEGDPGDHFYIIQEGSVECSSGGVLKRVLNAGDYFGEQALLYNTLRTATITAISQVKVLSLGREMLTTVLGDKLQHTLYKNTLRIAFDSSKYLKGLKKSQIEQIIEKIEVYSYKNSEIVIPRGTIKDRNLWVVLKGSLSSSIKTKKVFSCLGSSWIYKEDSGLISSDYFASADVDIGVIRKNLLEEVIDGKLAAVVNENKIIEILKKVHLFRMLVDSKLRLLSKCVRVNHFLENEKVFAQGEEGHSIYFVNDGEVNVLKDGNIVRTLGKGTYFGERSIINNEKRTASVICKTKAELYVLSKLDFMDIIDDNMLGLLKKRIKLQDDSIKLSDLVFVSTLGKGTFGCVYLCVNKNNNELYALKTVSRKKIESHDLQLSLNLERETLLSIDHQFIVKLVKTLKDSKRVYFLLEFVQGLSLYDVLRILNLLNTSDCRFYSACLVTILEHLHNNKIVYRDLKPENVMVDEDGYLKLLDFGTAKIVKDRTFTVIGTPHYMAPEVILGKGYNHSVDLWSLGVMIYEFVCGMVPFGENAQDEPYTIYKHIISGRLSYPKFIRSTCREKPIIEMLLNKVASMRGSAEKVKSHKWFNGIDWEGLLSRQLHTPYIPLSDCLVQPVQYRLEEAEQIEDYLNEHENFDFIISRNKKNNIPIDWDKDF